MKKVMIILAAIAYFPFLNAQVDSGVVPNDEVVIGSAEIPLSDVPNSLATLVNSKFDKNDPRYLGKGSA